MMAFFLVDVVLWIAVGPYPEDAQGWFSLLQSRRSVGLLLLSFPTLVGMMLYSLTYLGLYLTLRQVNSAGAALAVLFAFVGLAVLLVTSISYPMLHLSARYAAAETAAARAALLAAGEASITSAWAGVHLGGFCAEGALLLFSLLMLRSTIFGKTTAYLGIVGHGLDFARIVLVLALVPEEAAAVLLMIGGLPQLVWLVLVARRFWQLGRRRGTAL
jgi:hypothetical protein